MGAQRRIDWIRASLIVVAVLYAFLAGLRTVADFDLGWQIATGRYILQHHAIPSTDVLSYTVYGKPWLYPPFSEVLLYLLFQAGGFAALSWLSALACAVTVAFIVRQGSRSAAALAIIAIPAIAFRTVPRAELFTTVLFAAFATILWRHYDGRKSSLWLLSLMMFAWVNLHTGFVAGLALVGAYIVVELLDLPFAARRGASLVRLRKAGPWLAASLVATLVNPWGWRIYQAIAHQEAMMKLHSEFISEWSAVHFSSAAWLQAFSWRDPASADWWMLAAAAAAIATTLIRKEIGPAILLGVGAYAAVHHIRLQGLFAILVCIVGGSIFARILEGHHATASGPDGSQQHESVSRVPMHRIAEWCLVSLCVLFSAVRVADLVTDRYYLTSDQITLFGTGPSWWFPERAVAFLVQNRLPGNVFGDYNLGGYLTWRIGPEYADYFDGRFIPFGEGLFARHGALVAASLDSPEWQREADARNIQTVIFSTARFAGLGNFPLQKDCQNRNWTPVYLDYVAIIFLRISPDNADLLGRLRIGCDTVVITAPTIASGGSSWRASAERFQFLANSASIFYVLGRDSEAAADIANADAIFPGDPNLHLLKAQLAQAHGQSDLAEHEYLAALQIRPSDAAWYALAGLYASEHRYPETLHCVLESMAISEVAYDRYRALGKLYLAMNQPRDALAAFQEAARRSPFHDGAAGLGGDFDGRVAEGEAAAYRALGQLDQAIAAQLVAVRIPPDNAARWQSLADLYRAEGLGEKASEAEAHATRLRVQGGPGAPPNPALPETP